MKHLLSVELLEDMYCLCKGLKIELDSITLLTGDQGCGKSTLLNLLQKNSEIIKVETSGNVIRNGVKTFYFDTETMNPRMCDKEKNYSNIDGSSKGIGVGAAILTHFQSHGETLTEFTVNRIHQAKDCVLFLDEPESALSLRNQYRLAKEIKNTVKNNVQLIIATHCLPVIESMDNVYSLEHKKWMKSSEFIKLNQ